jgi:hypothetical protein
MTEIETLLKTLLFSKGLNNRWGLPAIFYSSPGQGKSSIIEKFCKDHGLHCVTLIASIREPSDFGGLPVPTQEDGIAFVEYLAAKWVKEFAGRPGVVFLDELTTCAPAVQAALLRLVLDGALGDHKLPNNIRFIAAANPTDQAAGGWDLAMPLANRFGHFEWPAPSNTDWCQWLMGSNAKDERSFSTESTESVVETKWDTEHSKSCALVASFIQKSPSSLEKVPDPSSPDASKAWPSRRTWEMASRALTAANVHGMSVAETQSLVTGFVGPGEGTAFTSFMKNLDLPDPKDIVSGTKAFKHNAKRLDQTMAILNSCVAFLLVESQDEWISRMWRILDEVAKKDEDLIVLPAKILVKNLKKPKDATKALARIYEVLNTAGINLGKR